MTITIEPDYSATEFALMGAAAREYEAFPFSKGYAGEHEQYLYVMAFQLAKGDLAAAMLAYLMHQKLEAFTIRYNSGFCEIHSWKLPRGQFWKLPVRFYKTPEKTSLPLL